MFRKNLRFFFEIRGIQLKKPPPCCRSGNNKGGFLNKVSQKIFASGGKTPIFGRFRVFLIAVNVFKIFVFSSVTTLSTVPVLKTIYDSIWWVDSAPQAKILEIWSRPKHDFPCKNSVFGTIFNEKKTAKSRKKWHLFKKPPLVADRGVTRGGFLKRGGFLSWIPLINISFMVE